MHRTESTLSPSISICMKVHVLLVGEVSLGVTFLWFDVCSPKHSICGDLKDYVHSSLPKTSLSLYMNTNTHISPFTPSSHLLTRKLQSEALLAGEEVCGELQGDGVEGAVRILG